MPTAMAYPSPKPIKHYGDEKVMTSPNTPNFFGVLRKFNLVIHGIDDSGFSILTISFCKYGPIVRFGKFGDYLWTERLLLEEMEKWFNKGLISKLVIAPQNLPEKEAGKG